MRIAIVYDCLYPHTVGGAERWYRSLAEHLTGEHEVTYLTRRQWSLGEGPGTSFEALAVSPGGPLYDEGGRRRVGPPIRFGIGVFWHLLRHGGRYDAVHTDVFPYFSLIGAWLALRLRSLLPGRGKRPRLIVDWFELWTRDYWSDYLGPIGGRIGYAVQRLCTRLPDESFVFSKLHEQRLRDEGHHAKVTRLTGIFAGQNGAVDAEADRDRRVVYAGRHIREKQVTAIPAAIEVARRELPDLHCTVFGDGPERNEVERRVRDLGLENAIELAGFVSAERIDRAIASAACLVLPSMREGYGLVVIEATSLGTPAVVVEGADNAAAELVEPGVNGIRAESAEPSELGAAIVAAVSGGVQLRRSTLDWYRLNDRALSIESALDAVASAYG